MSLVDVGEVCWQTQRRLAAMSLVTSPSVTSFTILCSVGVSAVASACVRRDRSQRGDRSSVAGHQPAAVKFVAHRSRSAAVAAIVASRCGELLVRCLAAAAERRTGFVQT